jgi:LysM repeat protein
VLSASCLACLSACGGLLGEQSKVSIAAPVAVTTAPSSTTTTAAMTTYVVVRGDTLSSIARRFAVTVGAITRANHLADANSLTIGQSLRIPPVEPITLTVTPAEGPAGTSFTLHLTGIAATDVVTFSIAQPGHRPFTGPTHTPAPDGSVSASYETYPTDPAGSYVVLAHTSSGKGMFATFRVDSGTAVPRPS